MRKTSGKLIISYRIEPDGATQIAIGRDAWALQNLIKAGEQGCTPITTPGPRWSHYTYKLRKAGVLIETVHEAHDGPFAGTHARYILRSPVTIISDSSEAECGGLAA